jgi:hypothetical protein
LGPDVAAAINSSGESAGWSLYSNPKTGKETDEAVVWSSTGTATVLEQAGGGADAINDKG